LRHLFLTDKSANGIQIFSNNFINKQFLFFTSSWRLKLKLKWCILHFNLEQKGYKTDHMWYAAEYASFFFFCFPWFATDWFFYPLFRKTGSRKSLRLFAGLRG
jgi:hypothetical protein